MRLKHLGYSGFAGFIVPEVYSASAALSGQPECLPPGRVPTVHQYDCPAIRTPSYDSSPPALALTAPARAFDPGQCCRLLLRNKLVTMTAKVVPIFKPAFRSWRSARLRWNRYLAVLSNRPISFGQKPSGQRSARPARIAADISSRWAMIALTAEGRLAIWSLSRRLTDAAVPLMALQIQGPIGKLQAAARNTAYCRASQRRRLDAASPAMRGQDHVT